MRIHIKAVIFDMDGVITDTMPYHLRAWQKIFLKEGIKTTHEDIYKREGQKGIDSVREIFAEKGLDCEESRVKKILKDKEELFKKTFKRRFITGSRSFIKDLRRRGFSLGLVTGTARHEAQQLLPRELWDCFDVIVCGCDVHNGKPHPEPYLKALQKLKINAHEALVLENAPFGIRSAKSAGIRCLAIATSLPKPYLKEADLICASFAQINKKVRLLKAG